MRGWVRGIPGVFTALAACAESDRTPPPPSVEVEGPLVGTFHSLTSFTSDDRPSTVLLMSVSEVADGTGCTRLTLDEATVAIDDAAPVPMLPNDAGTYDFGMSGAATAYTMAGVHRDHRIAATLSAPAPFVSEVTADEVRWSPAGEPDTLVRIVFAGEGDQVLVEDPEDTGVLAIPQGWLDRPGYWTVTVDKVRKSGTWWVDFDAPGSGDAACGGQWQAVVTRTHVVEIP